MAFSQDSQVNARESSPRSERPVDPGDRHELGAQPVVGDIVSRQVAHYGVRPGDIPFAFHGNGTAAMYHALMRGERGQIAEFDVVKAADWSAVRDKSAFRTIRVQPHGTVADE